MFSNGEAIQSDSSQYLYTLMGGMKIDFNELFYDGHT
jgi:hypothetical protein